MQKFWGLRVCVLFFLLQLRGSTAATVTYQFYQFIPSSYMGSTIVRQWSEIAFTLGGSRVSYLTASASAPDRLDSAGEAANAAIDNNFNTKFCGLNSIYATFSINMGKPVTIDYYYWCTANDSPERDPSSWTLRASNDNVVYVTIASQTNYQVTPTRNSCMGFALNQVVTVPTTSPTFKPTALPTVTPTATPTVIPTVKPTADPTAIPTAIPTATPTATPTAKPSSNPTVSRDNPYYYIHNTAGNFRCLRPQNSTEMTFVTCDEYSPSSL